MGKAIRLDKQDALVCPPPCGRPVWWAQVGSVLCGQCRAKRDGLHAGWLTSSLYAREANAEALVLDTEATLRAPLPARTPARMIKKLETLAGGRHPRGRRINTSARVGSDIGIAEPPPPGSPGARRRRSKAEMIAADKQAQLDRRKTERLARKVTDALKDAGAGNTDRQREAFVLVNVTLGNRRGAKAEAARRLGIGRQTLADLLEKYDKSTRSDV